MKKAVSIILIAVISLTFSACSTVSAENNDFSNIELVEWGDADRVVYHELSELENGCDIAVIGTFIEDAVSDVTYEYNDYFDKDIITHFKSYSSIEVQTVLKGDVSQGDKLKISQLYAVVDDRLLTVSDLTPMMKGDTWIFFLSESGGDDTFYWCTGDSDGRYPVKNCEYAKIALTENEELGVYDKSDFNEAIYNELLEKYDL